MKKLFYIFFIAGIFITFSGIYSQKIYDTVYANIKKEWDSFFSDSKKNIPSAKLTVEKLNKFKKKITIIYQEEEKKQYQEDIDNLTLYLTTKDSLFSCFNDNVFNNNTSSFTINVINDNMNLLPKNYSDLLRDKYNSMNNQITEISAVKEKILSLFNDTEMNNVKENISREEYTDTLNRLYSLPQTNVIKENKIYLDKVIQFIENREYLERKRQEEERIRRINEA